MIITLITLMVGAAIGFLVAALMAAGKEPVIEPIRGPVLLAHLPDKGRGKYFLIGEGLSGNMASLPPIQASSRKRHDAWIVSEMVDLANAHQIRAERIVGSGCDDILEKVHNQLAEDADYQKWTGQDGEEVGS